MIMSKIKKIENEIQKLKENQDEYIVRITLENYYHHLHQLYRDYNAERW